MSSFYSRFLRHGFLVCSVEYRVADGTTMSVLDILLAADAQAVNGELYSGDHALRVQANDVFDAINNV